MYEERLATIRALVDSAQTLRRGLWAWAKEHLDAVDNTCIHMPREAFRRIESQTRSPIDMARLKSRYLVAEIGEEYLVHLKLLSLYGILRPFLRDIPESSNRRLQRNRLLADVSYVVRQSTKLRYPFVHSPLVYHLIQSGSQGLASGRQNFGWSRLGLLDPKLQNEVRSSVAKFLSLRQSNEQAIDVRVEADEFLEFFIEHCYSLEELCLGSNAEGLRMPVGWLDPNFLAARLFGTRTAIPSFAILFDGGLCLSDAAASLTMPARLMLIRGPFGAGKSILALMLGAEVVRKGGIVSYVSLDNSLDALRGYLNSFNLLDEPLLEEQDGDISVTQSTATGGGLRLYYTPYKRRDLGELLERIKEHIQYETSQDDTSKAAKLRLLVIDPINSIPSDLSANDARQQIVETLSPLRELGGNILLVAEAADSNAIETLAVNSDWSGILPYIADTVIDITSSNSHGYEHRHIQVSKSRFQRERRGRHPLAIMPGRGAYVAPAPTAFSSEVSMLWPIQVRSPALAGEDEPFLQFGHRDIDRILGGRAIRRSDTIVLRGPDGCLKTLLGLHFLCADRQGNVLHTETARSILFMESAERANREFIEPYRHVLPKNLDNLRISSLPIGFVQPGRILQSIQEQFEQARDVGDSIDRVLFGDVGRWDVLCPFIREDSGFARALLDLFRSEGATVVFACSERLQEANSFLQRTTVDATSIVFDFEKVEFGGAQRVLMRTTRSPTLPASNDWHEASIQQSALHIDPSLLRIDDHQGTERARVHPIDTTLHLFEVGEVQGRYHETIVQRLNGVLNTPVNVRKLDRPELTDAARLGHLSIGSNLSIVQVDEHQLPPLKRTTQGRCMLHAFPQQKLEAWKDASAVNSVTLTDPNDSNRKSAVAFPYYRNIGVLTVNRELLQDPSVVSDWETLAAYASTYSDASLPFFDCAKKPEDYNCLFLEIALSLDEKRKASKNPSGTGFPEPCEDEAGRRQQLFKWIASPAFKDALRIFHKMCSKSHLAYRMGKVHSNTEPGTRQETTESRENPPPWQSVVSRQWYTSLLYCLQKSPQDSADLDIYALPSRVAISGEWYLGVWAHSAVPDIGLSIIDNLTSASAQLERLRAGIGLPTFDNLCNDDAALFPRARVQLKGLNMVDLLERAKRRSLLYRYDIVAPLIAENLQNFLQGRNLDETLVDGTVKLILRDFNQVLNKE